MTCFQIQIKILEPKSRLPIGRELKIEASHWSRGPQEKNLRLWPWFKNLSHFHLVRSSQCKNSGVTSEWMEWHQNDEMMLKWMEWHRNDEMRLEWMKWLLNKWNDIGMNGMMMNTMINWFEMTKWLEELANLRIKGHALIQKILHFTLVLVIWASFLDDKMIMERKKCQPNEVKPLPFFVL